MRYALQMLATLVVLPVLLHCLGESVVVGASLERHSYSSYRMPHLCAADIAAGAACPATAPMCCVASSTVRCCAGTGNCSDCTSEIIGYEMPRSSIILGCFSLSVLVLLGSIITSGIGRQTAWVLERRRMIERYRKRLLLRRAEAQEFKKELAETEVADIDDAIACVICCARNIDVALTPCGHVCCCQFCAKRLQECPVCRTEVQRCFDLPLYYVKQLLGIVPTASEEREGDEVRTQAVCIPSDLKEEPPRASIEVSDSPTTAAATPSKAEAGVQQRGTSLASRLLSRSYRRLSSVSEDEESTNNRPGNA